MEKNPKACEPCRRRKVRCNGQTPCNRCDRKPGDCVYRLRTRIRKSGAQRAAAAAAAAAATNGPKAPPPPSPAGDVRAVAAGSEQPTPHPTSAGHDSPSGFRRDVPEVGDGPKSDSAIYQSIAAVPQRSDVEPVQGGTARLFYGPACEYLSWKHLVAFHIGVSAKEVGTDMCHVVITLSVVILFLTCQSQHCFFPGAILGDMSFMILRRE